MSAAERCSVSQIVSDKADLNNLRPKITFSSMRLPSERMLWQFKIEFNNLELVLCYVLLFLAFTFAPYLLKVHLQLRRSLFVFHFSLLRLVCLICFGIVHASICCNRFNPGRLTSGGWWRWHLRTVALALWGWGEMDTVVNGNIKVTTWLNSSSCFIYTSVYTNQKKYWKKKSWHKR